MFAFHRPQYACVMGSYISNRNACAHTWSLFNDDHCSLSENRTRMSRSNLSRKALVSADARARPIALRAAFEAQIPTEVLGFTAECPPGPRRSLAAPGS